ncbi:hypothetical protein LTR64_003888 [Lithohypha guttulata]|uniref:uncharacterized protein n=1 Tax=Lithohypha guttulata TaxID=1690604 RepID=UPI002DE01CB4|nr:hypothetical protein LTR51_006926 [Lithohypha guttulata]
MKTPSMIKKSDIFLRQSSETRTRRSESTFRPLGVIHPTPLEPKVQPALSADGLRERLSRMFDENVKPKRRQSTDFAGAVQASLQTQGDAAKDRSSEVFSHRSGAASIHSLPLRDVPVRNSSLPDSTQASLQDFPSWKLPPAAAAGRAIPPRGRADSPIKRFIAKDFVSSDTARPIQSRTFIRPSPPLKLLEHGSINHRRIQLSTQLKAPLFVGGGTIEGEVRLTINQDNTRDRSRPLLISKLSVDVVGLEEVFLALASKLFHEKHPPPPAIASQEAERGPELFWKTKPGVASVPFCIDLPLNLGPPPYQSKSATIRYALLPTLVVKSDGSRGVVSQVCNIQMLTVFDPCKALASLPSPLVATETLSLPYLPGPQSIALTAGLHRQIWVSGNSVFVDIHIINKSQRTLRKLELQLQRSTLWYTHAAAETGAKNANHLRVPRKQENDIVNSTVVKKAKQWNGTPPHTSEVRTCHIQVPHGHVTISTGRFFEVRYFLNVIVTVAMFKTITVQLPITLIHMNSLDVMPNALAQVAASIEAKRSKTLPTDPNHPLYRPYYQGQAFVAPRKRSLEQTQGAHSRCQSTASARLEELKRELDKSPRKYQFHHQCSKSETFKDLLASSSAEHSNYCFHSHDSDCYHCHLIDLEHNKRPSTSNSQTGPKLPRLQVSTSGLGFTETELSDFTIDNSPPKKVMLSEQERKMIHQQRELQQRSEWTGKQNDTCQAASRLPSRRGRSKAAIVPNASALLDVQIRRAEPHVIESRVNTKQRSMTIESPLRPSANSNAQGNRASTRRRANTGPQLFTSFAQAPDHGTTDVKPVQDARQLERMSSKRRGKLPADDFVFSQEQPTEAKTSARPHSRRRQVQKREVEDRLMR